MFVACKNEPASPSQGSIECYLNGIIYDAETSAPLKGAKVSIGTQSDTTDQNGCFVLKGVAPGSYNMSVVKDGYLSYIKEDILVDSGRFYNKALSDEDKALLADLIKNGEEIDDNFMELLFGGERDVERNPDIETIGDSTTYGQAVVAVGLRPFNAVLEGNIEIKFSDGSVYKVPEDTGITAFCLDEPVDDVAAGILHTIASFKTTVKEDGNFGFKNIVPGFYYLFVDPMCVTHNDVSFDIDGMFFKDANIVANGSGRTDQLIINVDQEDPFKVNLKVLSVKAVDRSELPLASGSRDIVPEVGMKAGQAICIEFNKPIDESAYGTMFVFSSDHTQLTGYTQYKIINGDNGNGYAYVWHDSIQSAVDLRLFFSVSSFDKDKLDSSFYVDYAYQLNITSTNLYGYDYDKKLVDGVLKADQPIEIVFDKEIPENSTVEGILVKYTPNNNPDSAGTPVEFEYDGKTLFAYAPLDYRTGDLDTTYYTLKFKITTNDGIIIYNTENGLTEAALRNLVLITGENDCIKFKTASLIIVSTNVTGEYIPNPYSPFVIKLNQSLEGNTVEAGLFSYKLGYDKPYSIVPLTCKIEENYIIVSLAENKALSPSFEYRVVILVESERGHLIYKFDSGKVTISPEFKYFDSEFHNGLEDFTVTGDKYDWNSKEVDFSWTSLGIDLGKPTVYQLWKRRADAMAWTFLDSINELSEFNYNYRDKTIMFEELYALAEGDLLYDGSVEFLLISYDEDGLMVQSPVLSVKDTVEPDVEIKEPYPYIEPETLYSELFDDPIEFTLTADEPIDSIKEADVVIGGAHPDYFEVTWEMTNEEGIKKENEATFTVKVKNEPSVGSKYEEGDLMLTITLRDTSYNQTEKVIDFKGQDL